MLEYMYIYSLNIVFSVKMPIYSMYKDLCKYMVCVYYYLCYLCKYLFVGIESSILRLFSQSGQTNLILCYVIIIKESF